MTSKAIPESALLSPRDPSLDKNSDAWPEFELKDVKVHLPGEPSAATSLLEATEHYTLTLTGHLEPLNKNQAHLLLQSIPRRAPLIEVSDVRTFAFGQYEGGHIGLWAGGKAGWFALSPSRAYKPIWNEMVEAVNLFYWIADAYKEKRKKGTHKTAPLLPDYTPEEIFEKYAAEEIEDEATAEAAAEKVYRHRGFMISSMIGEKEGLNWMKNPLYLHLSKKFPADHATVKSRVRGIPQPAPNNRENSESSETSSLKRKRGRPARSRAADVLSLGWSSVADEEEPKTEPASRSAPQQSKSTTMRTRRQNAEEPSTSEPPDEEATTPHAHTSDDDTPARAMKGRSALRPKPSKAGKGASKGGKAPPPDFQDDNDEDELAPSPTAAKRRHEKSRAKRGDREGDVDEGIDIPSSPSNVDPSTTPSDSSETGLGAIDGEGPSDDLAVRLKHALDPVQEDTWVCALDGCSHKVYAASRPDSQKLIREHYVLHAYDDDDRVQLVKGMQHPLLPVNHLMERVRMQARKEGLPGERGGAGGPGAHSRFGPGVVVRY